VRADGFQSMTDLFDLRGKVAWITGASVGGLGYHHAQTLTEEGVHVAISDLSSRASDLAETESKLRNKHVRVLSLHTDVSKEDDVRRAVADIERELGTINILVNNAGIAIDAPALEMRLEDWNHVLNVNLTGAWLCARTVCELMVRKRVKGKIVNIASTYGLRADMEACAPYYASKAAIINLTRALAIEWAPFGINVNAIAPGYFPTHMTKTVDEDAEVKRRFMSRILLKRAGDPARDLTGALIFLTSSASDYVTGQTIYVDGGWTAT